MTAEEKVLRDALWMAYCTGRARGTYIPEEVVPGLMARLAKDVCPECDGGKLIRWNRLDPDNHSASLPPCPRCKGTAKAPKLDREKVGRIIHRAHYESPLAPLHLLWDELSVQSRERYMVLADQIIALFDVGAIKQEGRKEVVERIVNDTRNFEVPLSLGLIVKLTDWNL